jgi:hypothetical protein
MTTKAVYVGKINSSKIKITWYFCLNLESMSLIHSVVSRVLHMYAT